MSKADWQSRANTFVTPFSVTQYQDRIDSLLPKLRDGANDSDMSLQHVFANHLVLKASGLIELGVRESLAEYAQRNGNTEIKAFIRYHSARENSLDCEKIERIMSRFSSTWWSSISGAITDSQQSAVDSLKTLRDQIAHGKHNGTGFSIVEGYYRDAKGFLRVVEAAVIP